MTIEQRARLLQTLQGIAQQLEQLIGAVSRPKAVVRDENGIIKGVQ